MSIEDPFAQIRSCLDSQARLLLDPIVSRDDPFRNGNRDYRRHVEIATDSTTVFESWPIVGRPTIRRECLFTNRQIQKVSIFYPLSSIQGYDPSIDYLVYSANLGLGSDGYSTVINKPGQVHIFRRDDNAGCNFNTAEYNQGIFTSLKLGNGEVFLSGLNFMFNGCVLGQNEAFWIGGKAIRGRLFSDNLGRSRIAITEEDRRIGKTNKMLFPFRFELKRLGELALGWNVNLLYDQYPAEYRFTQATSNDVNSVVISAEVQQQSGQNLAEETCRKICRDNNLNPTKDEVTSLVRLRDEVQQGKRTEWIFNPRLEFAKWLYEHGRISG